MLTDQNQRLVLQVPRVQVRAPATPDGIGSLLPGVSIGTSRPSSVVSFHAALVDTKVSRDIASASPGGGRCMHVIPHPACFGNRDKAGSGWLGASLNTGPGECESHGLKRVDAWSFEFQAL